MSDKSRIGIIGAGRMGLAMLRHLVRHGYLVAVCDLDPKQCDAAQAAGRYVRCREHEAGAVERQPVQAERETGIAAGGIGDETDRHPVGCERVQPRHDEIEQPVARRLEEILISPEAPPDR